MSALVSPTVAELAWLNALQAAIFKTTLATTELRLFKNDIVPGPGSLFADFIEGDFTGYSSVVIATWYPPSIDPISNRYRIGTGSYAFSQSGTTITNTIYGWYLEDGSGGLYAAGRFDSPIEMDANGKQIFIVPFILSEGISGPDPYED